MAAHRSTPQDISDAQYSSYMVGYQMYTRILLGQVVVQSRDINDSAFHQQQLHNWAYSTKNQLLQFGFDPSEGRLPQLMTESPEFRAVRHSVRQLLVTSSQQAALGLIQRMSKEALLMWDYMIHLHQLNFAPLIPPPRE